MSRAVWFRRRTRGVGWTPCAWQGWLVTAGCLGLSLAALYWGPGWDSAALALLGVVGPLILLAVVAFTTDDAAG